MEKVKTSAAKERKLLELLEHLEQYKAKEREFKMLIATYLNITKAKHILVNKMKKISELNLFVKEAGGDYKVTTPE